MVSFEGPLGLLGAYQSERSPQYIADSKKGVLNNPCILVCYTKVMGKEGGGATGVRVYTIYTREDSVN